MRFGIFSFGSGNVVAWYDSEPAALEAVGKLFRDEPDCVDDVGLMQFDEHGHPERAVQGARLAQVVGVDVRPGRTVTA